MSLLSPQVEKLLQDTMKQGGYASPDDVVLAGLASLKQQSDSGEFEAGELDALLEEGENSGRSLDGEQVLDELRIASRKEPGQLSMRKLHFKPQARLDLLEIWNYIASDDVKAARYRNGSIPV